MVDFESIIDDSQSYKSVDVEITDEELQIFFEEYFYLLNESSVTSKLFLQENQNFFEILDNFTEENCE